MWHGDTDELNIRVLGWRNNRPGAITDNCAFDCDANHARTSVLTWLRRNAWSTHTNEITDGLLGVLLVLLHGKTPSCLRHYAANRTQSSTHAREKSRRHRLLNIGVHSRNMANTMLHSIRGLAIMRSTSVERCV